MGRGVATVLDDTAWVLVDERHDSALGPALAWALRRDVHRVALITSGTSGVLARRAQQWHGDVSVQVWHLDGTDITPARPDANLGVVEPLPEHLELAPLIAESGAEVVIEHGIVAGEVAGLEVCRVVTDPTTEVVRVEVGVGAHDREAFAMLHGDVPVAQALSEVVATVAQQRRPGAAPHPLNRLARERLVRSVLLADPGLVGAQDLAVAPPPVVRTSLKDAVPCVAVGRDRRGDALVVVCSTGIDLDVVPFGVDARASLDPSAHLVIAVEERDDHPVQRRLAAAVSPPGEIRTVTTGV
jgi:hypothetical protein